MTSTAAAQASNRFFSLTTSAVSSYFAEDKEFSSRLSSTAEPARFTSSDDALMYMTADATADANAACAPRFSAVPSPCSSTIAACFNTLFPVAFEHLCEHTRRAPRDAHWTTACMLASMHGARWVRVGTSKGGPDTTSAYRLLGVEFMTLLTLRCTPPRTQMANCLAGGLTPVLPPAELERIGFKLAAYPLDLLNATIIAQRQALAALAATGALRPSSRFPSTSCRKPLDSTPTMRKRRATRAAAACDGAVLNIGPRPAVYIAERA